MIALRAQLACLFVVLACGILPAANLDDSIQAFHKGDYRSAYDGLTALVQSGEQDARVYYYRGLITYRVGDRNGAARDFKIAATLEAAGLGVGVGESLQRVQGPDRLMLEKYRAMARLSERRKVQPVAPPAIPEMQPAPSVQLTSGEAPLAPTFRLASEVPHHRGRKANPFLDDSGLLADEKPAEPVLVSEPSAKEEPIGTGVASAGADSPDEMDIFGDLDDSGADDDLDAAFGSGESESGGESKTGSVFGAIFRAFTKTAVPQVSPERIIPGGLPIPGMQGPGMGPGEDEFGDPSMEGEFGDGDFGGEGFGDEEDMFGGEGF